MKQIFFCPPKWHWSGIFGPVRLPYAACEHMNALAGVPPSQVHTSMGTIASLEPMGGSRFCSLRN